MKNKNMGNVAVDDGGKWAIDPSGEIFFES